MITAASILAILKLLLTFVAGYLSNKGVKALGTALAQNQADETKASDPAQGNDVTDLDDLK